MVKLQKTNKKGQINLDGPGGNAFFILGVAQETARRVGVNYKLFKEEATSGSYVHLLRTFEKYFGSYYVLTTTNKTLVKEVQSGNTTN